MSSVAAGRRPSTFELVGGRLVACLAALAELGLAAGSLVGCSGDNGFREAFTAGARPAPPSVDDVVELTVADVAAGLSSGEFTAVELTMAFLDRIEMHEERYNAFVSLNPQALADAAQLDEEYRENGPRGPLHGVPVVVKDNIDVAGMVTTVGFDGFSAEAGGVDMAPQRDAPVVARLREAGAVILGKTNLPDFASHGTRTHSSVAGTTLNPYDTTKAPGGSSGGTATAVNASFAVLGLGTETGGSIQNPASAQGLVGVKPTQGLIPMEGIFPLSGYYVDVVGPITRSVPDAAIVMDVLTGDGSYTRELTVDGREPPSFEGLRFGLVGEGWRDDWLPLDSATAKEYRSAVAVLEALGAEPVEAPFAESGFKLLYSRRPRVGTATHDVAGYLRRLGEDAAFTSIAEWESLAGESLERFARGDTVDPGTTEAGREFEAWRSEILDLFASVLDEHSLDGLFFPQAASPSRDLVEDPEQPGFNPNNWPELPSNIVNDIGLPTVVVPASYYPSGLPFVAAFIGRKGSEVDLLKWAAALERATNARMAPRLAPPFSPAGHRFF